MPPCEMEIATINDLQALKEWLLSQLPASVSGLEPEIILDGDELLIVLNLKTEISGEENNAPKNAELALIEYQRNATRKLRIQLGRHLEHIYGYTVSWGMRVGGTLESFTPNTTAVMTRLSRTERQVLDTLIAANVANTRSAALSYIVRIFATEYHEWLGQVQEAAKHMASLRTQLHAELRAGPPPEAPAQRNEKSL